MVLVVAQVCSPFGSSPDWWVSLTQRDKVTGEEITYVEQWTDVALRENGRWAWIADHGTVLDDEEG